MLQQGNVTTVAPFVGREGSPGDEPPNWDTSGSTAELVCTAHQHNARVVGHLGHGSVEWPQVVNASWRAEWVSDITHWFIETQGMDGIQFDVEDLEVAETAAATDLVCELRAALNTALPGSTLSWCSDFPPSADPGWNFTRLGDCLDHFVIMVRCSTAHTWRALTAVCDRHWGGCAQDYSPHGLGPGWHDQFTQGVKGYGALGVPPEQLIITLAWFGVKWQCAQLSGINCTYAGQPTCPERCRPLDNAGYAELLEFEAPGAPIHYQPTLTPSPYIDLVENGTRFRWEFDDARSAAEKMATVRAAKVGGVGVWTADALDYSNGTAAAAMWQALLSGLHSP